MRLFGALRDSGIARVAVTFDGEGDSGQIEDIIATDCDGKPVDLPTGPLAIQTAKPDGSGPSGETLPVSDAIENLCYDRLGDSYGGWQDNEGSYGEFLFDVADRTIDLTFNSRFTDVETSTVTF
jgi:hypothetical protein